MQTMPLELGLKLNEEMIKKVPDQKPGGQWPEELLMLLVLLQLEVQSWKITYFVTGAAIDALVHTQSVNRQDNDSIQGSASKLTVGF